jgi:valyl-tRNA synthetase
MVAKWPEPVEEWEDDAAEARVAELQELIGAVRNIRSEYGVQPGARVRLRVAGESPELRTLLGAAARTLADLARVEEVAFGRVAGEIGASAVLRSGAELFLPLADVIDLDRERVRLRTELDRVAGMKESTRKRLENEGFVARAPEAVVQKEREKLDSLAEQEEKLTRTLRSLEGAA